MALLCHVEEIVCFIPAHMSWSFACMRPLPLRLLGRQLMVFLEAGHATGSGQSSNGLTLNLSSNNPFRNRAPSPASLDSPFLNKPASPFDDPPARPLSRNPFLDQAPPQPLRSPGIMSHQTDSKSLSAEEIFVCTDTAAYCPGGKRITSH